MTREDVIRMAREVNGHAYTNRHLPGEPAFAFSIDRLERFAEIVAAAEREACAKVCENYTDKHGGKYADYEGHGYECAAAIRARGNK